MMVGFVGFFPADQECVEFLKTLIFVSRVNFLNESFVFVLMHLWQNTLFICLKAEN